METNINASNGEKNIISLLRKNGYFGVSKENNGIKADGSIRKIFVYVNENKNTLTKDLINKIKKEAHALNREPWVVHININDNGEIIGDIEWKNMDSQ